MLFVPPAATFTPESVMPSTPARIHDTRLPPPQFEAGTQSFVPAEPNFAALSAWKVWPRHTVMGLFQVLPLSVHDVLPSPFACSAHEPVLCDVSHMPSMPALVGQALA